MGRETFPEDFWQQIDKMPNSWLATGYLWSYLLMNPRSDGYSEHTIYMMEMAKLRQMRADDRPEIGSWLFGLFGCEVMAATEEFLTDHTGRSFELTVDYLPVSEALIRASAIITESGFLGSRELLWPVKTTSQTTTKEVCLYYGDGSKLYNSVVDGPVWSLSRALEVNNVY